MSDPVIALLLIVGLVTALALVRFFKTLDPDFFAAARTPLVAGVVAGVLILLPGARGLVHLVVTGVVLTAAALYSRLTGDESEASEGMLLGAAMGAAASLPSILNDGNELRVFSQCVLAGAVAGFGVTFAAFHVADKLRQVILDLVTAAVAVLAAQLPALLARWGVTELRIALIAAAVAPVVVIATVVKQYPDVRAELRHEASLGFINDDDVRSTAHPLLRLGRSGWVDRNAHREFVRIANRVALRKRQQRNRSGEMARLYQLEIMKLRMQMQQMSRIDHETARQLASRDEEVHSDTMAHE